MMAAFCSLVEPEREKKSTKIVEVDVRVGTPTEDIPNQLLALRHEARLPFARLLAESPNSDLTNNLNSSPADANHYRYSFASASVYLLLQAF